LQATSLVLIALLAMTSMAPALTQAPSEATGADESLAAIPVAPSVRSVGDWNLGEGGLALVGFDPVACFPEGGGKARKGSPEMTLEQGGAIYRFASEANRDRFRKEPARYEPAYGGWCAWAMAQEAGEKVEVDPESFLVQDSRMLRRRNRTPGPSGARCRMASSILT
jgi:YHS domain-containing protein